MILDAEHRTARSLIDTPWRRLELSTSRDIWCLVDADVWDFIVQWRWNWGWKPRAAWKHYAKRNTGAARDTVYLHRELMLHWEPRARDELFDAQGNALLVVDHINGQSLDNRRANLRWLTPAENRANTKPRDQVPTLPAIVARLLAGWSAPADVGGDLASGSGLAGGAAGGLDAVPF